MMLLHASAQQWLPCCAAASKKKTLIPLSAQTMARQPRSALRGQVVELVLKVAMNFSKSRKHLPSLLLEMHKISELLAQAQVCFELHVCVQRACLHMRAGRQGCMHACMSRRGLHVSALPSLSRLRCRVRFQVAQHSFLGHSH